MSAKAGRRSRPLPKNEGAEFATGLIIGECMLFILQRSCLKTQQKSADNVSRRAQQKAKTFARSD